MVTQEEAEHGGEGGRKAGRGDPDAVDFSEGLDAAGQHTRDDDAQIRFGGALIVAELLQPALGPGLRALRFPQDGAAV